MEYVLYNPITNKYLQDDETLATSKNLQQAMIIAGEDLTNSLLLNFPSYEKRLIVRPNSVEPSYITLL